MEYFENLNKKITEFNKLKNFEILKADHGDVECIKITMTKSFLHAKGIITVSPTLETFVWLIKAFKEEFEKIPCRICFAGHHLLFQKGYGFVLFDNNLKLMNYKIF